MPGAPSFIALDWGTSSLRAWRFGESPNPQEKREFPWGIMKLPSQAATREDTFHDTFLRVCSDWLAQTPCPVLACGMLGSAQGWQPAAYLPCPVTLEGLAKQLTPVIHQQQTMLHIIPGVIKEGEMPRSDAWRRDTNLRCYLDGTGPAKRNPSGYASADRLTRHTCEMGSS